MAVGRGAWIGIAFAVALVVVVSAYAVFHPLNGTQPALACDATVTANTTLGANIGPCAGNGLVIGADGVVLNCAGRSISGTGTNYTSVGIQLIGITKVTVKNCNVTEFGYGLALESSSNHNTFTANTVNSNDNGGFVLYSSSHNTFTANTANNNTVGGFALYGYSNNNTFTANTANNNYGVGFDLSSSNRSTFSGNTANSNTVSGFGLSDSSHNTFTANTANKSGKDGFALYRYSDDNSFTTNTVNENNGDGFDLCSSCSVNTLSGNTANGNKLYGYQDTSTGSGKAGTANVYTGDICSRSGAGGSDPGGLGTPQP